MRRRYHIEAVYGISLLVLAFLYVFPMKVYAADAVTAFGSDYYTKDVEDGEFPVGIYIRSEEEIGNYHLELQYDTTRLRYVSGADTEEAGRLVIDGAGTGTEVKTFLYFEAFSGGEAGISFTAAEAYTADGSEVLEITELDYAPITISGEDTSGISFRDLLQDTVSRADQNTGEDIEADDVSEEADTTDAAKSSNTGETEQSADYLSADAIYEKSVQMVMENNRDRMLQLFVYFVIFLLAVIMLLFLIVMIRRRIKRGQLAHNAEEKATFSLEFDAISEEQELIDMNIPDDEIHG